jgi:hypothetical protein
LRPWLRALLAALVAAVACAAGDAAAQCRTPGQSCGVFGGDCCSGSSCVIAICVQNPPTCTGEAGLCLSSSQCCGSRVCELGFCRTPVDLGDACGPAAPCKAGLACDPLAGFRCVDQTAQIGEACGPLVHCAGGLVCDPLAGFVCVDQSATLGQACGPLVQCQSGLVCDPLAGFTCVEARTPDLGEACGPLFPCATGLTCDPLAGFRCVDQSVGEGRACGPLVQCDDGLFCDPLAGFRCVDAAGVDEACGPGVPCQSGLQCSLALRCSHAPALAGETCDATTPCGDGLFCQPGIPQRCQLLKRPGEGCSAVNPCIEGASCEACFVEGCNAPLQCFWNANEGAITEQQCRTLYSPGLHRAAQDIQTTMTYAVGNGISGLVGESQSFGVAYGQDGRYGCYTTLCAGINSDIAIEHFVAVGFQVDYESVDGASFANFQEVQLPGDVVNFSTSQEFAREPGQVLPLPELVGTEDALSIGVGAGVIPFSAGSYLCETVLDTVIDPALGHSPVTLAVAPSVVGNPGFALGLGGWSCEGEGTCARAADDALGSMVSGSGEVTSPPPGSADTQARLVSDCTAVAPGLLYEVSAWVKTTGARPGALGAEWNAGLDCDGPAAGSEEIGSAPPDGAWTRIAARRRAPLGAQSVRLYLTAERDAATSQPSVSRIDAVLIPEPARILVAIAALLGLAALRPR